jgi:cytochrome c oxidase assembly protein subunit 11
MSAPITSSDRRRRDVVVAAACGMVAAAMIGAAYAAVPFYNWFCRTTGFGGTPQVASAGPSQILDRKINVRFDANVTGGLPWRFEPEQNSIELKIGEVVTVSYRVVNESARETVGIASYNVSPPTVGGYFTKINCFCFSEQRLKPGEVRDMTVVFFVDPALAKDAEQDGLETITLSYTMYPVREPRRRELGAARRVRSGGAKREGGERAGAASALSDGET